MHNPEINIGQSRLPLLRHLAVGGAAIWAMATPATAALIYTSGHGDLGVAWEAGALVPHYHLHDVAVVDGTPVGNAPDGVEFEPDEILTYVSGPSLSRPAGSAWDFTGVVSGAQIWFLPQVEDPAKPFFGIASEELVPAEWTSLSLSLVSVSGPAGGNFSLFQNDSFGNPLVRLTTADGITGADSFAMTVGGHAHYNWAFTQPGIYDLTLQFDGQNVADGAQTATATFRFGVTQVPEPGCLALGLLWGLALLRRRR